MTERLNLQTLLEEILGSSNVYFQPPPSIQMAYPAIVYNRDTAITKYANNRPYGQVKSYQVTVISSNVDSLIPDRVAALPMCDHVRFYSTNGLNHDVFTLYY